MVTHYPNNLDSFRAWLNELDGMISQDINDLFDSAEAIEVELGAGPNAGDKPSGNLASIYARLFASGNISEKSGLWQRLRHKWEAVATGRFHRSRLEGPYLIETEPDRYRGSETVFGDDMPAMFGQMQYPLTSTLGATQRAGMPWKAALVVENENQYSWVGVDGEAWNPPNNELVGSNQLAQGYWVRLEWGLRT